MGQLNINKIIIDSGQGNGWRLVETTVKSRSSGCVLNEVKPATFHTCSCMYQTVG